MIIITTHKESDFDALASLIAASLLYPDAKPVLPMSVNANLKAFLAIHKDLFKLYSPKDIIFDHVTTLVVVDTHSWNRLDGMEQLKDNLDLEIIVWDHHSEGDIVTPHKHIRETGATVTLLVKEIEKQKKEITPIQATLFLMGLYEDTGNMSFPSTLPEDAYAAGFLLEQKADLHILSTFLRQAYGKKQKDILFQMIQDAKRKEIGGFSISIAKMETAGRIQNLAMVLQMYREIVNVDAAFGIFKDIERNKCMVIGRSSIDEINIGLLMRSIGGGGHPGAGSALLKAVNPDTIEEILLELISGNQHSSVMLSDIMSYPVVTINEDRKIKTAAMKLRELGCTGMPVVDKEGKIVGVISRRDFKKLRKSKEMNSPVKAFMTRNVITISYDKSIIEAARLMIKHDIGRIPVLKKNKIVGIITRSDAMTYFYDLVPD
ncbi:MAG: CBS domain-containing protein [Desulfobacula sp.]|jgi:nanoRNase/pAp phosphatase (c-di-AMP/oligoRNAs hydrolase)/CBS domain-containing protein|uniref:CBS domain-containing protein n=1 Tax=Desulfobacula sp. TaxID=2593537 RepID=UPI001D2C07B8|nr:CBS domain-containing protein [Desulfobacula sp.]MBT3484374.1 CBS domain-containing protein [Desulfobacula sp.]MBT3803289.1 CBS domain-containing protein [Desulfobacula sp.]MBT4023745.1 CBS domain-containing protein [Desulfobacula sp.]MBT4197987.1 CBS domain-containing protein [Desulfobacula sp.]